MAERSPRQHPLRAAINGFARRPIDAVDLDCNAVFIRKGLQMPVGRVGSTVNVFGQELDLSQPPGPDGGSFARAGPLKRDCTDLRFEGLQGRNSGQVHLAAHAWLTQRDINYNVRPGPSTLDRDNALMPTIVEMENRRKPELELSFHPSASGAADAIAGLAGTNAHRRVQFQAANGEGHHFIADVHCRSGHPPSILLLESAMAYPPERYMQVIDQLRRRPGLRNAPISIIETHAQKSGSDCGIFCLSFAHKLAKHQDLFRSYHEKQRNGEALGSGRKLAGVQVVKGEEVLPADFYKHAHSMQHVERLARDAGQDPPVGHAVGSSSELEGLVERRRRLSEPTATNTIGVSIEHKRRDILLRSFEQASREP